MAKIKIDLDSPIANGQAITFRSPIDCSTVDGLVIYYIDGDSNKVSRSFQFADAHGNNVGNTDLFASDVLVKIILDTKLDRAYVQNADFAGKITADGGEIFNDYENNQALGKHSSVFGSKSYAGIKGYYWGWASEDDMNNNIFTLLTPPYMEIDGPIEPDLSKWEVGDLIYFTYGDYTRNSSTSIIAEIIEGNKIRLEANPFTDAEMQHLLSIGMIGEFSLIWNHTKPYAGVDLLTYSIDEEGNEIQVHILDTDGAHVEGIYSAGLGHASHAEGSMTIARGYTSHAEGYFSRADGHYSHAEGYNTFSEGEKSHAEGQQTKASGDRSHAEGQKSKATANCSHAEGYNTSAGGSYSHAEGFTTSATGENSHAEGERSVSGGKGSHAEGYRASAAGDYAHAEGYGTKAPSKAAHAEGYSTTASGESSHAEGTSSTASGKNSHAEGDNTIARTDASHVQGKYNIEDKEGKYAHIIGNGTSATKRSNAHTIDWDGNAWFAGGITANGKNLGMKLIWENAAAGSTFPSQAVAVGDLSPYNYLIVVYRQIRPTSDGFLLNSQIVPIHPYLKTALLDPSLSMGVYYRSVQAYDDIVTFSDGIRADSQSGKVVDNNVNIPYSIYACG